MQSLPLFKSHYSIGKSILTLEDNDEPNEKKPSSIIEIAKRNKLKSVFLVEDSMNGFLEAFQNCEQNKIKLVFGLTVTICEDYNTKDKDSVNKESLLRTKKVINA